MRQDVLKKSGAPLLFRGRATQSATRRIFGSVTVIVPPSGKATLTVAVLAMLLLGLAAWYVEIPQRAKAVGILMPPDGLIDIVAIAPGRIANIHVSEGQAISRGDALLNVTSGEDRLASHKLQTLEKELALLNEARAAELAIDRTRLLTLAEQLASADRRLALARKERGLQEEQVRLLERRWSRRRELAESGSLSIDALDQEQSALLQSRTRLAALRHSVIEHEQRMTAIQRETQKAKDESALREVLHRLEQERIERQVIEVEYLAGRTIRASGAGIVARVSVLPGEAIRAGDALLKIYKPYRELEAWIYMSTATTGFVAEGQLVKIRFDAYPHQIFGTADAIVTAVSSVAVVPWELKIPLALNDPVFEIRARLDQVQMTAFDATWPLRPGTSFRAELVQRRYRLYQWLLRSIVNRADGERA